MTTKAQAAPEVPSAPPDEFLLSLDEFCARLSQKVKKVALIGGFHFHAKQTGLLMGKESQFMAAWEQFRRLPG